MGCVCPDSAENIAGFLSASLSHRSRFSRVYVTSSPERTSKSFSRLLKCLGREQAYFYNIVISESDVLIVLYLGSQPSTVLSGKAGHERTPPTSSTTLPSAITALLNASFVLNTLWTPLKSGWSSFQGSATFLRWSFFFYPSLLRAHCRRRRTCIRSQQSIQKVVSYAFKYFSRCADDLWDCIVEEFQRVRLIYCICMK